MAKKSPSNFANPTASKWLVRGALIAIAVVPFIVFPPVRFASKKTADSSVTTGAFNARDFSAKLWAEKLLPSVPSAVDARTLYSALEASPASAAKKYARTVGIGGTTYYFISGEGTVTAVDDDSVALSLGEGAKATLVLDTGLIFGNALRDGTSLLDVNAFSNSEEFNAIAAELNAIVEATVLPCVRQLGIIGAKLRFAGIAEVTSTDTDPRPLHLVPIKVEAKP